MRLLLDSNTINYILKGQTLPLHRLDQARQQGAAFVLCPVVSYEVRRYLELRNSTRMLRLYDDLTAPWERCELTFEDWEAAASTWAERHRIGRAISDPDLLIAVAAKKIEAILVTSNTGHFQDLGLPLENWLIDT